MADSLSAAVTLEAKGEVLDVLVKSWRNKEVGTN